MMWMGLMIRMRPWKLETLVNSQEKQQNTSLVKTPRKGKMFKYMYSVLLFVMVSIHLLEVKGVAVNINLLVIISHLSFPGQ